MMPSPPTFSPWPHRWAVVLVCATFPLIWIGGLVTTTGAGMAFPHWLTIEGRFFLFYPLERWASGPWNQFIEHGHRLPATLVGVLTIVTALVIWRCDDRRWMRWLGVVAVLGVCFQGLLGGLRVNLNQQVLAMVHGCVGPLFFCVCVAIAVFTSRFWRSSFAPQAQHARLFRLAAATTLLAYVQLVVGAWLRHFPAGVEPGAFRIAVMFHLLLAAIVVGHVLCLGHIAWWRTTRPGWLLRPALGLLALVLVQIALGGATWVVKYGWPYSLAEYEFAQRFLLIRGDALAMWTATAHVATGSLILATGLLAALRTARSAGPAAVLPKPRLVLAEGAV